MPTEALAEAIAAEWESVVDKIDPRSMPLTGLANAAIDRVAPDKQAFAAGLARYAEADLACYRAEGPNGLIERQAEHWDALLGWGRRRFDVDFNTTSGIIHVDQPAATVERLAHAVAALDAFRLAGLVAAGDDRRVAAGGARRSRRALSRPSRHGTRSASTTAGSSSNGDRTRRPKRRLANRRWDFLAAARFLELLN